MGLASVIGIALPRRFRFVCSLTAANQVLGPQDTEWPLANPSEEPFYGKAALAEPPAGHWTENRPISRSKTGRAFGS